MHPVFYVIAILGCSEVSHACQQQRIEPTQYTSPVACQEAMPDALRRNTDIDAPLIEAACRANGPITVDATTSRNQRG